MKIPKANSPDLWKYPKLLAEIIYPDMTVDEIVEHWVKFAEQEWELEDFIPYIERIVPQVLRENISKPPDYDQLEGMYLGCTYSGLWILSHTIQDRKGYYPVDSLFLWMMQAAYHIPEETDSFLVDLNCYEGIVHYSLEPEIREVLPLLHEATRDFVLAYGWQEYLSAACTHQAICEAMNQRCHTKELFITKLSDDIRQGIVNSVLLDFFPVFIVSVEDRIRKDGIDNADLMELVRRTYHWLGDMAKQEKYKTNKDILELIYKCQLSQYEFCERNRIAQLKKCKQQIIQSVDGIYNFEKAKQYLEELNTQKLPKPEKP